VAIVTNTLGGKISGGILKFMMAKQNCEVEVLITSNKKVHFQCGLGMDLSPTRIIFRF